MSFKIVALSHLKTAFERSQSFLSELMTATVEAIEEANDKIDESQTKLASYVTTLTTNDVALNKTINEMQSALVARLGTQSFYMATTDLTGDGTNRLQLVTSDELNEIFDTSNCNYTNTIVVACNGNYTTSNIMAIGTDYENGVWYVELSSATSSPICINWIAVYKDSDYVPAFPTSTITTPVETGGEDDETLPDSLESWTDVQMVVRAGEVGKYLSVGDQLQCNHSEYGTLTWDVVAIDTDSPSDENYAHSLTLALHNAVTGPCYDYSEYNRYSLSDAHKWLTCESPDETQFTAWYTSTVDEYHKLDMNPANGISAWAIGLDEDFLAVVGAVDKICALNTVYAYPEKTETISTKFFLPAVSEVWSGEETYADNDIYEGDVYEGMGGQSNSARYTTSGTLASYVTRSPYLTSASSVMRYVSANDGSTTYSPSSTYQNQYIICCCIV